MKITLIIFITLLFNFPTLADLISPNPKIKPDEVIAIQLEALKNNNLPNQDSGISQTWEFDHPQNRQYTGPLANFAKMMKSDSYVLLIDHEEHNIILVSKNDNTANYPSENKLNII